jgi:hypothetical protein
MSHPNACIKIYIYGLPKRVFNRQLDALIKNITTLSKYPVQILRYGSLSEPPVQETILEPPVPEILHKVGNKYEYEHGIFITNFTALCKDQSFFKYLCRCRQTMDDLSKDKIEPIVKIWNNMHKNDDFWPWSIILDTPCELSKYKIHNFVQYSTKYGVPDNKTVYLTNETCCEDIHGMMFSINYLIHNQIRSDKETRRNINKLLN